MNLTAPPTAPTMPSAQPTRHPLPARPSTTTNNFAYKADSIGLGGPQSEETAMNASVAIRALGGDNSDVIANRFAIRMANMSAAEMLKAELAGRVPASSSPPPAQSTSDLSVVPANTASATVNITAATSVEGSRLAGNPTATDESEIPGLGASRVVSESAAHMNVYASPIENATHTDGDAMLDDATLPGDVGENAPRGIKRSFIDDKEEEQNSIEDEDEDDEPSPDKSGTLSLKVNPDGTAEQEDLVKWVCLICLSILLNLNVNIDYGSLDTENGTIAKSSVSSIPTLRPGKSMSQLCFPSPLHRSLLSQNYKTIH